MTLYALPRRPFRPTLAAGALLALALSACGSDPAEPPAAAASQGTQGATQPATQAAPAGTVEERMSTANCQNPPDGRVYFTVGSTVFAVPGPQVRTVLPPDVTPQTTPEQIVQNLRTQTAQGAGCPEKPLAARVLGIGGEFGNPLLTGEIGILAAAPGSISGGFSRVTRGIQQNPDPKCQKMDGGLLACTGTDNLGGVQSNVLYVVTTDPKQNLLSGGPLAARCILADGGVRGCSILDELPGGVAINVPLSAGPDSTQKLAAAHAAAVGAVNAVRR